MGPGPAPGPVPRGDAPLPGRGRYGSGRLHAAGRYTEQRDLLDAQGVHLAGGIWDQMLRAQRLTAEQRKQLDSTVSAYAQLFGAVMHLFVDSFLEGYGDLTDEQRQAAVAMRRTIWEGGVDAVIGAVVREKVPS